MHKFTQEMSAWPPGLFCKDMLLTGSKISIRLTTCNDHRDFPLIGPHPFIHK